MKKSVFILLFTLISALSFGQSETKTEFVSIKVQYGIKTTGFVNKVWVDIGQSGQHSLSGEITNEDGEVKIEGRTYTSEIDVLNYFGEKGWVIYSTRTIRILNEDYYYYLLKKETK